ncbi:PepSY domain-containing protein [Kribbella yunnanensis]|uniref:PepSY domain-containing protein n=1 Tax=Kribbella yunnanensis TaxID=190194 RepID=A0ABN2GTL6_9ACTN
MGEVATAPVPVEAEKTGPRGKASGLFRAFWRWHFYASFLVIPMLLILAGTGLIYLFRFQIEPMLHADLMKVQQPAGLVAQPYSSQLDEVRQAFPDATVVSMTEPSAPNRSTVFSVDTEAGPRDVFVDPYEGKVLGALNPDTTLSGGAILLHGELMAGRWGDYVIEIAACWAIVMALTGYFLFLRGRVARARRRAAGAAGAVLRSRHGRTGAVLGIGLLFLIVSGLPWTGVWGKQTQELVTTKAGTSFWAEDPGALSNPTSTLDESLPHSHAVPWGLGKTDVPRSNPADKKRSVATVDTAIAVGERNGLRRPMTIALPADDEGVYSAIGYAFNDPGKERTLHVDQYGGRVVSTYGYADYPALAKVVAQGIALHEGRRFGTLNLWVTTVFCIGVVFMCVTGPLMWWRRRPKGKALGAPRGRLPLRATPALAVLVVALALFLPLFGITLIAVLLLDQLVLRRVAGLRAWFNVAAPRPGSD